jgi:hypothetical protein
MRHTIVASLAAILALLAPATQPSAASAAVTPGRTVCTITDSRAIGLSGLVATANGYTAISDSNVDKSKIRIFFFNSACTLRRTVAYPTSAFDPEDVAIGRDGSIYVADIGDNASERASIAVWRLAPASTKPHIFRYAYPDHAHDAEAMLLAADDTPIFVTKEIGISHLFVPSRPPDPNGKPVPLRAVATFRPTNFRAEDGLGLGGGLFVTGGAVSTDRTRVALRTYSTAYEWRVPDGDLLKAITTTKPVITPLPGEPQGEAIAYTPEGRSLLTVSDLEVEPVHAPILSYTSTLGGDPTPTPTSAPSHRTTGSPAAAAKTHTKSPPVAAFGLLIGIAALLIGSGAIAIAITRRRRG